MRAMRLVGAPGRLRLERVPVPQPGSEQVLVRVQACGVCRTDLHVVDGELADPVLPVTLGHQIVGAVTALGVGVDGLRVGDRVGIPWLGWTCGSCTFCRDGAENLCDEARFTGYQLDGGFAEYALADARYCFAIDPSYPSARAAPLLCAGLIGYRALRMADDAARVGLYGFGAAAHIAVQVLRHRGQRCFAFTRPGDARGQAFARDHGVEWAGDSNAPPPEPLDAAILFAPVGALVPVALGAVRKGGTVICAGIHMSNIPSFPYDLLWGERTVRSVANLTRQDGVEFLALAPRIPIRTEITTFALEEANAALDTVRAGEISGAVVVVVE